MEQSKTYAGVWNDENGGMTAIGNIVRDAWVFGLIPETESCEGWTLPRIQQLWNQVQAEWDKHGMLVSNLPPELRERHERIYREAMEYAREHGWDPELGDDD